MKGDILDEDSAPRTETVELWRRNPVECVEELIGNPEFKEYMKYAPYRLYANEDGTEQSWDEMASGSWWWDTQVSYEAVLFSKANDGWIGRLTRWSYDITHHPCEQQDPAHDIQWRQAGMARLSHNWKP